MTDDSIVTEVVRRPVERNKQLAELRLALESRGYKLALVEVMLVACDERWSPSDSTVHERWVGPGGVLWLEQTRNIQSVVTDFTLFGRVTESTRVDDMVAAIEPRIDWDNPPRRGEDWDVFEAGGALEVQRFDEPAEARDYPRFASDDDAASFVLMTACWDDCPRTDVRNECRDALREIVYQEGWDDEDMEWLLLQKVSGSRGEPR